ncbi:MAG: hypothetical protein JST04_09130 [Bdellovibrionales bacterium]|nr:hypothetical protein [Bdellovibrionales bacterium]
MRFQSILLAAFSLSLCAGCATTSELNPEGEKVFIVDAMTAADAKNYVFVGKVNALMMLTMDSARNELRNKAAKLGATIVRITENSPVSCSVDFENKDPKNCYQLDGEAYRPRVPAGSPVR